MEELSPECDFCSFPLGWPHVLQAQNVIFVVFHCNVMQKGPFGTRKGALRCSHLSPQFQTNRSCICKIAHTPLAWPALWPQQCAPVPPVAPPSPSPSSVVALSLSRLPFPLQQTHVSGDSGTAKVEAGIVAAAAAPTAVQRYSDGNHSSVGVFLAAGAERLRVQACSIPAAGTAVIGGSGVVQA